MIELVDVAMRNQRSKLVKNSEDAISKLQAWRNSHSHQLLEQQLACIWHENLHDRAVFASRAVELVLLEVGHGYHTTLLTHMYPVGI